MTTKSEIQYCVFFLAFPTKYYFIKCLKKTHAGRFPSPRITHLYTPLLAAIQYRKMIRSIL